MKHHRLWRRWTVGLGLLMAATLRPAACFATPIVDGTVDAEYGTPIATSPLNNLLVDPANSIDDEANPSARSWDCTDLYATNSGDALFIFVRLPKYSLTQTIGSWGVVLHLGGANASIAPSATTIQDSYGAQIYFQHSEPPQALIKSNARSSATANDGVGGWGYLNLPNADLTIWSGWDNPGGDVFGIQGNPDTSIPNVVRGSKNGFAIAYRQGDGVEGGIEMRIPFAAFGATGALTPPAVGDVIKMQFYGTTRVDSGGGSLHPRGVVDCVPYEAGSRTDPFIGYLTQYASYTVKQSQSMDVIGGGYTNTTTAYLLFSDAVGAGGTTPANYTVTDLKTNTPVAVTAAVIDPTNSKKVILTTAEMTRGHRMKVSASEAVKSTGGVGVTPALNSFEFVVPVLVVFTIYDVDDAANGYEPVTLTGGFTDWANAAPDPDPREIILSAVPGQPKTYRTPPVEIRPGRWTYKYRIPKLPGAWDILNRRDFRVDIGDAPLQELATDYGSYTTTADVTFTLIDTQNKLQGKTVFITGNVQENAWSTDPTIMWQLEPTGAPNTYATTQPMRDGGWFYKYYVPDAPDPWNFLQTEDWYIETHGTGDPLTFAVTNIIPSVTALDVLKVAAGVSAGPTPASGPVFKAYDKNGDGKIDAADAVAFVKQ